MSNELLDPKGVKAKFGVPPERIVDYLALMGDAVDNVPGVDKVGPKTAAKLIQEYGSLDGVMAHADEVKGVVGENLRKALDWLPTGRELVTVKTDVALPFEIESLVTRGAGQGEARRALRALRVPQPARGAGQGRCLTRPEGRGRERRHAPGRGTKSGAIREREEGGATPPGEGRRAAPLPPGEGGKGLPLPSGEGRGEGIISSGGEGHAFVATRNYEMVMDEAALDRWLAKIEAAELTCFDTETTSLDPMTAQLVGLSFCVEAGEACYIPLAHRYPGAPDQLDREATLARLEALVRVAPDTARSARTPSTTATCSPTTASTCAASCTTRCSPPTCWRATSATTWIRSPCATWGRRPSSTRRSRARAPLPSRSTR